MSSVVLLSGGIDSLVCAEAARRDGDLVGCVFIDYGHPAQIPEGWKAFAYCGQRGVTLKVVHVFGLNLGDMASEAGARVVPCRNSVLLSCAANAAVAMGGNKLVIGASAADFRDYPDCRPDFFEAMGDALDVWIEAPLIDMTKPEIIGAARELGLTQSDAWSCYLGGPIPCGACPSCIEANRAWSTVD